MTPSPKKPAAPKRTRRRIEWNAQGDVVSDSHPAPDTPLPKDAGPPAAMLGDRTIRWPNRRTGPWEVEFTFDTVRGRGEITEVRVRHVGPELEILGAKTIKSIPFGPLGEVVRRREFMSQVLFATAADPQFADQYRDEQLEEAHEAARKAARMAKPRSRGNRYDEAHYQEVAKVYRQAEEEGSRSPRQDVVTWAHRRGDRISDATAKGWIDRSRALGLIGPYARPKAKRTRKSAGNRRTR